MSSIGSSMSASMRGAGDGGPGGSAEPPRIGIRTSSGTGAGTGAGRRSPGEGRLRPLTPEVPLEGELTGGNSPPKPIMIAAVALAVLSIAAAAGARLTGAGHQTVPATPVAMVRDFRFADQQGGDVVVYTVGEGNPEREVARLRQGEMMFVRSTVRALARQRRIDGLSAATPFRVTRYQNGRLTLDDPATNAHLELASFGPTNQAAFEQLMDRAR